MNCNGDVNFSDNSIICLDTSQDESSFIHDEDKEINSEKEVIPDKTLSPGTVPDGFIIIDETFNLSVADNNKTLPAEKESPMFKVIFRDNCVLRQYETKVKEFFERLIEVESTDNNIDGSETILKIWGYPNPNVRKNLYNDANNKDNILFTIDNTPGSQDKFNIPTYGTRFENVLKTPCTETNDGKKIEKAPQRMNCFNCMGDHNLRDCPKPRNQLEINKNRKEFTARTGPRNTRYHIDDEQKYKPGVLSSELRKALGLADNELPKHIFKMRLIGYPPGWLEEAKLEHSGLNLYDSEGKRQLDPTEEAGEIFTPEHKAQYDTKKLHDFPGFNIPAPPDTHDAFWSADQQLVHSKETMLKMLSNRRTDDGYKRKKFKVNAGESISNHDTEPVEMDVECPEDEINTSVTENGAFVPPLPIDSVATSTSNSSPGLDGINLPSPKLIDGCETSLRPYSPSLSDLESKKKLLLAALDASNLQSNPGTPVRVLLSSTSIVDTPKSSNTNTPQLTPLPITSNESTPRHGSVKSVEFGTPVLETTSIYTKLPSSEKFSKDICDVINFENLPGTTGHYEKLNGILQKIRDDTSNDDNEN